MPINPLFITGIIKICQLLIEMKITGFFKRFKNTKEKNHDVPASNLFYEEIDDSNEERMAGDGEPEHPIDSTINPLGRMPDMEEITFSATNTEIEDGEETVTQEEVAIPMPGVLRTDNLVKRYGKRTVANHVSINVKQGEIVGLLGPNGAGKTTTFYMTTGLITPNEGKIFLDGQDITSYPVYKRAQLGIGYLAQEPSVFRKLSVENNIRAVLEMTPTTKEYQKEKLESLIAEFRLQEVRKNLGDQLSGGERRRTEIARCLAINPKFIMLDEPFAGVDPIAVEDIQEVIYKLKSKNIGILITDHNAPETLSITDRAYLLFEGKILFQGTSEELAVNPVVKEKYLGRNFVFRRKKFDV